MNYCEEKGISTSDLNEAQRTLYYTAENMKMDKSISEEGYEHFQKAIKALEQEPNTWSLDDAREDFMHDVYNTLDFLPTNEEANQIIDSFDRVTSSIGQEHVLEKIRTEIEDLTYYCCEVHPRDVIDDVLDIIDKYKGESEGK